MTERQRLKEEQQQKLLTYIIEYKRKWNGNSPSYREMMAHMAMDNTGQLLVVLQALAKQEKIILPAGIARSIIIPGTAWDYVEAEVCHA
jgi:SOS-response transcriptional repressor LexA